MIFVQNKYNDNDINKYVNTSLSKGQCTFIIAFSLAVNHF